MLRDRRGTRSARPSADGCSTSCRRRSPSMSTNWRCSSSATAASRVKQARADALALVRYFEFYAGAARDKLHGETIPYQGRLQRLHLARAARGHGPHHPLELPDADLRAQRRRRPGRGQRLRGETVRGRLPVADPGGPAGGRGRLSAGGAEHRDRLRPRGRRRAGAAPGHRPHQLHRQPQGGHADPAGGGQNGTAR